MERFVKNRTAESKIRGSEMKTGAQVSKISVYNSSGCEDLEKFKLKSRRSSHNYGRVVVKVG